MEQRFDPPDPHPLDFDWRFTPESTHVICDLLSASNRVLAVGVPSVARHLETTGKPVVLVDRQPLQGVSRQLAIDLSTAAPLADTFEAAVIDPPWYPDDLSRWAAWTSRSLRIGSRILLSMWPESTRPSAQLETEQVLDGISKWAEVEVTDLYLNYELPRFEKRLPVLGVQNAFMSSPGVGRLFSLEVRSHPNLPAPRKGEDLWWRLTLDCYQLALRMNGESLASELIVAHPQAREWHWPFVSKRAPDRDSIDIWSSDNEVALVHNAVALKKALQEAYQAPTSKRFESALTLYPQLLAWNIPRPPYRRTLEWHHLQ